jgi:pimeloyl-ACP methyl ester carboxylesterase
MLGSAVLVHGAWSHPEEWRWVIERLTPHGIEVIAVDLPSHRSPAGTRDDDVEAVEQTIAALPPPVVAVGWSYGGAILTELTVDPGHVTRLVYVASIPNGPDDSSNTRPTGGDLDLSHFAFPDEQTMLLRDDWWHDGSFAPFAPDVLEYLAAYPRRPVPLEVVLAPTGVAPKSIATTLILGQDDNLHPPPQQEWAVRTFDDVRIIDSDHFIPVRAPEVVADVVLEALGSALVIRRQPDRLHRPGMI